MSITGVINTHFIVAFLLQQFGTDEQKQRFLPQMATGEYHAAFSMSEPNCGSDVQAMRTRAVRDNGDYVIDGTKMWVTNGERSTVVATLVKTDPDAPAGVQGMSCILAEKKYPGPAPASTSTSSATRAWRPPTGLRGQPPARRQPPRRGRGPRLPAMMAAIEVGRINVAARGVGVAQRAFELALAYAQNGTPSASAIAEHQAIQFKLADMATKIEAARLMT